MKSSQAYIILIYIVPIFLLVSSDTKLVRQVNNLGVVCPTKPYNLEVASILEIFHFTPSCALAAIEICENGSPGRPIHEALSRTKATLDIVSAAVKTAIEALHQTAVSIQTATGCMSNSTFADLKANPRHCTDVLNYSNKTSGIRTIYPFKLVANRPVSVYCDQEDSGGGWTVIAKRDKVTRREDFFTRNWNDYAEGFGNVTGEYWIGLRTMHMLTTDVPMELRVELEDYEGVARYALYSRFKVDDETTKFKLSVSGYTGSAGDSLTYHNGFKFSTPDNDNDGGTRNCAKEYGAFWHTNRPICHHVNLGGIPHEGANAPSWAGVIWNSFKSYRYSLKKAVMMVRPVIFA